MKQLSHVEKMRAIAQSNKEQIMELLGWDELKYCEFQEQQGREYLKYVLCPDGYGVRELGNSRLFWRWWINQWNRRDDDFLQNGIPFPLAYDYMDIHSIEYLQGEYPHKVIFEASYSVMMGEFLDAK